MLSDLYRCAKAKQREKILGLVNNCDAMMIFLVWITVTQMIMELHFRLFKRGVFYNHMQCRDEARKRFACFEFCRGAESNPAAKALDAIGAMLFDAEGKGRKHLKLLHCRYGGKTSQWPLALTGSLQISLLMAFARFWRLLFYVFQQYPWRLAPVYDPDASLELKQQRMDEFLALPVGSRRLDPGLCRRLRAMVSSREELTEDRLARFLHAVYSRLVMTSTFVERVFGHLTHWLGAQHQELPTIAAKHITTTFDDVVKRWRTSLAQASAPSGKCRPSWVHTVATGSRQTGLHVFLENLPRDHVFHGSGHMLWRELDDAERSRYKEIAAQRRKISAARFSGLDQHLESIEQEKRAKPDGPWNICSQTGHSVHPDIISRAYDNQGTLAAFEKSWTEKVKRETQPAADFPATVEFDGPFDREIPAELTDNCRYLLEMIRLALRFEDHDDDSGVVLQFQHGDCRRYCFAAHSLHLERGDFEAEIMHMHVRDVHAPDEPDSLPVVLTFSSESGHGHDDDGFLWPCISTETNFAIHLAERANVQWACYALHSRPLAMSEREVFGRHLLELAKLKEMDDALAAQRRAMALFRQSAGLTQPRGRGGRGTARGRGGRGRGRGGEIPHDRGVGLPCDVSSDESDEDRGELGEALTKLKAKLTSLFVPAGGEGPAHGSGEAAAGVEPVVVAVVVGPHAPAAAAAPPAAGFKARPGERVLELWAGRFPFSEVAPGDHLIGYGVHCGRHVNADGTVASTPCKKWSPLGRAD